MIQRESLSKVLQPFCTACAAQATATLADVLPGDAADVVVVDYSQNDNRPTIEDAREGGAAVDASVRRVAEAFLVALVRGLRRRRAELEDAREGLGRRDRLAQRDLAPGRVPRRRQAVQGQVPELPHGVEPRRRQSEAGPGGPGQVQAPLRLRVLGSVSYTHLTLPTKA